MIEFSLTEIGLFITNVIAWALWLRSEERRFVAERIARAMIQDKEIRDKIVLEFENFQQKHG
jgi:hypothetical protein